MRYLTMISLATALAVATTASAQTRPPPAQTPEQVTPVQHRFQMWRVACDNGLRCFAWSAVPDGSGWIRIALSAGADAHPEIAAGALPSEPGSPTGLRIDDRAYAMTPSSLPESGWIGTLDGDSARRAIDAMAAAPAADVTNGATTVSVPLSGFSQSLDWIDRQQGRTHTTTALRGRGDGAAPTVPPPPALPRTDAAAVVAQTGFGEGAVLPATVEAMSDLVACRNSWGEMYRPARPVAARLDATTELWGAPCSMTTYNTGYLLYLTGPDGRDPRRAGLPGVLQTTDIVVNPAYDPETRTLTQTVWANKWGHCGRLQTWVWTGTEFALQTEQAMAECTGIPPPFWPTLWRTR